MINKAAIREYKVINVISICKKIKIRNFHMGVNKKIVTVERRANSKWTKICDLQWEYYRAYKEGTFDARFLELGFG